jgi:hypothetical protein
VKGSLVLEINRGRDPWYVVINRDSYLLQVAGIKCYDCREVPRRIAGDPSIHSEPTSSPYSSTVEIARWFKPSIPPIHANN